MSVVSVDPCIDFRFVVVSVVSDGVRDDFCCLCTWTVVRL